MSTFEIEDHPATALTVAPAPAPAPRGSPADTSGGLPPRAGSALTDEVRAAHLALSPHDLALREWAASDPEMRAGETFRRLAGSFLHLALEEQQAWPTLIGSAKRAELAGMTQRLGRLIREIPQRIFGGDAARIARFYDLGSPHIAEMILAPPDGFDESVGRADVVEGPGGMHFLEFNFSVSLGGWDARYLGKLHGAVPAFREFARREGIELVACDPAKACLRHLIACARRRNLDSAGPLHLAVLVGSSKFGGDAAAHLEFRHVQEIYSEVGEEQGVDAGRVFGCRYADLSVRQGRLTYQGLPLAALLELEGNVVPPAVYSLYKQRKFVLLNGPADHLLATKRNIALLSAAGGECLDAEDLEFISRTVPWTREVTPGDVTYEGERHRLADLLLANRERLVLKKGVSNAGLDIVMGPDTPPSQWQSEVDAAFAAGGWVAQEIVHSWPYLYQHAGLGGVAHNVIWGPFLFGAKSEGVHVRVRPQGGGLVSVRQGATQSVVFEV